MRYSLSLQILLIALLFGSCKAQLESITAIQVHHFGQFFDDEKKSIFTIGNDFKMIDNENIRIYVTRRISFQTKNILDSHGVVVDEKVVKQDTSFFAHVLERPSRYGLTYNITDFRTSEPEKFGLDSLMENLGIEEKNMLILNLELGSPLQTITNGELLLEKFLLEKINDKDPDSIFRYYDRRLKTVDFSFSPKLDNSHNSKLCKTLIIDNPARLSNGQLTSDVPRRVMETSFSRVSISENFPMLALIDKFKKDKKKFNF